MNEQKLFLLENKTFFSNFEIIMMKIKVIEKARHEPAVYSI